MIEILVFFITAKQPSNPPPPPMPEKIVAVLPKELKLIEETEETTPKETAKKEKHIPLMKKEVKLRRFKRKIQRRGKRNH